MGSSKREVSFDYRVLLKWTHCSRTKRQGNCDWRGKKNKQKKLSVHVDARRRRIFVLLNTTTSIVAFRAKLNSTGSSFTKMRSRPETSHILTARTTRDWPSPFGSPTISPQKERKKHKIPAILHPGLLAHISLLFLASCPHPLLFNHN